MSRAWSVTPYVRGRPALVVVFGLVVAGCSSWGKPAIPFELTQGVESVVADWQRAGLSCSHPEVGMPGPAVDWWCRGQVAGVEVNARLIADTFGVQSIHAGVPARTPTIEAARAFAGLVAATSFLELPRPEIEAWLLANGAEVGTMPMTAATPLGRTSIARDDDGSPVLYITPLGSSILIEQ